MRSTFRSALAVLLLPVLLSCGGDDDPAAPAAAPLDGVGLDAATAVTLGKVHLTGLPAATKAGYEDYQVLLRADGAEPLTALVEEDESGPFFRATLHPVTPNAGGAVRVQVSDGSHTSPELELQLEPLPAAPGAFERLLDTLQAIVEQRAQWAGTSFAELAGMGFDEVPDALLPLKVAQSYLDGGGPHDLRSLVANADGFLNADERELLDRMFGYARLDLVVQADIDGFAAGTTPEAPRPALRAGGPAKLGCIDYGPDIGTAQELVDAMVLAALGDTALDPDGAGRYLEAVAYLFTGLGTVPGVGRVFTVAGVGLAVWQAATAAVRGTYPSRLTALEFDLDKSTFEEDDATPARWSNVMLTASSTGWVADQDLINVVLSTVGAYVSLRHTTELEAIDALRDVGMAEHNADLQDYFDERGEFIEFCPQTWTVDISDPDFSTAGVLEHRFAVDRDAQTVTPLDVGDDALRIATVPGLFAGQDLHADVPLESNPILVVVEPAVIRVEQPGETVQITARIRDAEVTSLYWNAQQGTWEDDIGDDTNDGTTRPLKTPTQRSLYPFRVEVESTSGQGLRAAPAAPRRWDFAEIRLDSASIRIAPRDTCIQPGDDVPFRAAVSGLDEYEVVWSKVEGYGSIDQGGVYHSLSQGSSNAVIAAHIAGRPDIGDTTRIEVRGCTCHYQADLGVASFGGSDVAYQVTDLGQLVYTFFFMTETGANYGMGLSLVGTPEAPAPEPGDFGPWEASFSYFSGDQSWVAGPMDEDSGVTLYIEQFTDTFMEGRVSGIAVRRGQDGGVVSSINVNVTFRAGNFVDGWPCE